MYEYLLSQRIEGVLNIRVLGCAGLDGPIDLGGETFERLTKAVKEKNRWKSFGWQEMNLIDKLWDEFNVSNADEMKHSALQTHLKTPISHQQLMFPLS